MELTIDTLKSLYPDIYQAVRDEGHTAGLAEGLAQGQADAGPQAAAAERDRIKGVLGMFCRKDGRLIAGLETLAQECLFDGTTTVEGAAVRILAHEREKGADHLSTLRAPSGNANSIASPAAPAPGSDLSTGTDTVADGEEPGAKVHKLATERAARDKITYSAALNAVLSENPKLQAAYMRNNKLTEGGN